MLRAAVAAKTEYGMKAKAKMNAGELVSDDIVLNIIKDNIFTPKCKQGFVLDGFPRNMAQARALDDLLAREKKPLNSVLKLEVPDEILEERICGRRIHKPSGRPYHLKFNPPKVPGKDDITGEDLIQRKDDN